MVSLGMHKVDVVAKRKYIMYLRRKMNTHKMTVQMVICLMIHHLDFVVKYNSLKMKIHTNNQIVKMVMCLMEELGGVEKFKMMIFYLQKKAKMEDCIVQMDIDQIINLKIVKKYLKKIIEIEIDQEMKDLILIVKNGKMKEIEI